jgi:hypothetical protein
MPSSIPPPLDEPLNTYFAVQLKQGEQAVHVAEAVMKAAKTEGILFRRLEVLDTMSLGSMSFARMRSEIANPFPILDRLYIEGRAVVNRVQGSEYAVRLQGGRVGKVTNVLMHATAKLGQSRMYRGTKFKYWARQFEAAPTG